MANQLQVADLQELMEYSPRDGGLYWRERTAEMYLNYIDDIGDTEALRLSRMFNTRFAGQECGTTRNGNKEFVRVSLGTRGPNIRRARLELIWAVATGEWSDAQVLLIDPDKPATPDNLVRCSSWVAQIFANPSVGLHRMVSTAERYYWRIVTDNKETLHQDSGYTTLQDVREARDTKLKELGLWVAETLDEKLNG
jgi:hypothetical protein